MTTPLSAASDPAVTPRAAGGGVAMMYCQKSNQEVVQQRLHWGHISVDFMALFLSSHATSSQPNQDPSMLHSTPQGPWSHLVCTYRVTVQYLIT